MKVLARKGTVKTPWGSSEDRFLWLFEPRDFWVGFYWKTDRTLRFFELYVTVIPMLPVKFTWRLPAAESAKRLRERR